MMQPKPWRVRTMCWGAWLFLTRKSLCKELMCTVQSKFYRTGHEALSIRRRCQLSPWCMSPEVTGYDRSGGTVISGDLYLFYWHEYVWRQCVLNIGNTWSRKLYGKKKVFIPSLSWPDLLSSPPWGFQLLPASCVSFQRSSTHERAYVCHLYEMLG